MIQVWVIFAFALGEIWTDSHPFCLWGPVEVPIAKIGEDHFSMEAETKKQRR